MGHADRLLPSADQAIVEPAKIVEYLLNGRHPDNGGKAQCFESLGFTIARPGQFAAALRAHALIGDVVQEVTTVHGTKYVVEGYLDSPMGRQRLVRTVWIIDKRQTLPRLVTAYPRREQRHGSH